MLKYLFKEYGERMISDAKDQVEKSIEECQRKLIELKQAYEDLENGDWSYHVQLMSLWADYGEKMASRTGSKEAGLDKVIEEAEDSFRKINKREDIQAKKSIYILCKSGLKIPVAN